MLHLDLVLLLLQLPQGRLLLVAGLLRKLLLLFDAALLLGLTLKPLLLLVRLEVTVVIVTAVLMHTQGISYALNEGHAQIQDLGAARDLDGQYVDVVLLEEVQQYGEA